MRIFIGLTFEKEVIQELVDIQEQLQKDLKYHKSFKWIAPQNLHITLVPPWNVTSTTEVEEVLNSFSTPIRAFSGTFTNVWYGPQKNARLIWITGSIPPGLVQVQDELYRTLGKPIENRNFVMHTTLARFDPRHKSSFARKTIDQKVHIPFPIASFTLFESQLLEKGVQYRRIKTFYLKD
jgi:RNA 2',3'-cyclic 3'-phosphodiesterase